MFILIKKYKYIKNNNYFFKKIINLEKKKGKKKKQRGGCRLGVARPHPQRWLEVACGSGRVATTKGRE
jgi:ubiquinone/menaquinone biosynthesis C-methylase UbiE